MKAINRYLGLVGTLLVGVLTCSAIRAQTPYNLTVHAGEKRQTFAGFGASQATTTWSNPPQPFRDQMADLVYRDLGMNTFRMWISCDHTQTVSSMVAEFHTRYIATGAIAGVKARGVDTLLLAPCRSAPVYHWTTAPTEPMSVYADRLAEVIAQIELTYGIQIDATGVANEPGAWTTQHMVDAVNALRPALDARGLKNVKIIAPETSNGGANMVLHLDAMFHNGDAWRNLSGMAHHSYNWSLADRRQWDIKRDKEWWMTECSDGGAETPEDENRASTVLARFMSDLNTGVDRWIYFQGFSTHTDVSTYNNSHAFLAIHDQATQSIVVYLRYYYLKQALETIRTGAVVRYMTSATEGGMHSYANLSPRINAAAAVNPDGSWGVNIVNATGIDGLPASTTNLFHPAENFNVTVTIQELASTPSKVFTVWRSKANSHIVNSGSVTFVNGVGTVTVNSRELVSLRSAATAPAVPVAPLNLVASLENNAPVTLTWANSIGANSWIVKRRTGSSGSFSPIATTGATRYTDTLATPGTIYNYVVSAVNALGESANSAVVATPSGAYGFVNQDIGSVGAAGYMTTPSPGVYALSGSGDKLNGLDDGFNYSYVKMSGDGTFIARVASTTPVPGASGFRAGIMMRDRLTSNSPMYGITFAPYSATVRTHERAFPFGHGVLGALNNMAGPVWMKLTRSGGTLTASVSSDGTTWTEIGTSTHKMFSDYYVGLAVCSHNNSISGTATFDNVSFAPQAPIGLKASATVSTVTLNWQPVFGVTGYKVKRATTKGGPYTTIATPTGTSFTDTTATAPMPYFYVVSSTSASGESVNSEEVRGDTVAWWDFSRETGERVADRRLGGIPLKPNVGVSMKWAQEGLAGSVRFDGTLRLNPAFAAPTIVLPNGKVAAEAWIKVDPAQIGAKTLGVLQYGNVSSNGFRIVVEQNRKLSWLVQNGSSEKRVQSTALINGGVWTHVAGTYDGANMKVYINGVLQGTLALTGGVPQPADNSQLFVGYISSGSLPFFYGEIRSVRIHSKPFITYDP